MCKYRIFWRNSRDIHSNFAANHLYSGLFLEKSWKIAVKVVFLWSICASNVRQMCVKCASNVRQNQQTLHPSAVRVPSWATSHDNIFTDAHYVRAFSPHDHHRN